MRSWIVVILLLELLSGQVQGQEFTIVANNALRTFVVVQLPNQCPRGVCKGACNCTDRSKCGEGFCPKTVPAPLPKITEMKITYGIRAPVGDHTHTCRNGHTWDHAVTTSHNCPICGAFQNIQDRSPRMVNTVKITTVQTQSISLPPYQPFGQWKSNNPNSQMYYGNCPGGNCQRQ